MNKLELKEKLQAAAISEDFYSLDGGLPNEAFCLDNVNGKWETYYSERGNKSKLKIFDSESAACDFFYTWITSSLKKMNLL